MGLALLGLVCCFVCLWLLSFWAVLLWYFCGGSVVVTAMYAAFAVLCLSLVREYGLEAVSAAVCGWDEVMQLSRLVTVFAGGAGVSISLLGLVAVTAVVVLCWCCVWGCGAATGVDCTGFLEVMVLAWVSAA